MKMNIKGLVFNTFKESARNKMFYLLVFFGILFALSSKLISFLTLGDAMKVLKDTGLAAINFFCVLIAIFTGINLVYKEIEKKTIYNILSKPVTRDQFIIGKFLGLALTMLVALARHGRASFSSSFCWSAAVSTSKSSSTSSCCYLELLVIVAISLLFSSFTTPILSFIFTVSLYLIGHVMWTFNEFKSLLQLPALDEIHPGALLPPAQSGQIQHQERRGPRHCRCNPGTILFSDPLRPGLYPGPAGRNHPDLPQTGISIMQGQTAGGYFPEPACCWRPFCRTATIPPSTISATAAPLCHCPRANRCAILSFGYQNLTADLLFIWSIQFYSTYYLTNRFDFLERVYDTITDITPPYKEPYIIGALIMAFEAKDIPMALRLLDKGSRNIADEWFFDHEAGYYCYKYLKDYAKAEAYYDRAAAKPNAPSFLKRMKAHMVYLQDDPQGGLPDVARYLQQRPRPPRKGLRPSTICTRSRPKSTCRCSRRRSPSSGKISGVFRPPWPNWCSLGMVAAIPSDFSGNDYHLRPRYRARSRPSGYSNGNGADHRLRTDHRQLSERGHPPPAAGRKHRLSPARIARAAGADIPFYHNIPLLSYVILRGPLPFLPRHAYRRNIRWSKAFAPSASG